VKSIDKLNQKIVLATGEKPRVFFSQTISSETKTKFKQVRRLMEKEFIDFAARFFRVPAAKIKKKTKIKDLQQEVHDPVVFSFEVEKHYGIEIDEDEYERIKTIEDYMMIVETHLAKEYKKAA
jgi:acyl carrier protein